MPPQLKHRVCLFTPRVVGLGPPDDEIEFSVLRSTVVFTRLSGRFADLGDPALRESSDKARFRSFSGADAILPRGCFRDRSLELSSSSLESALADLRVPWGCYRL